MTTALQRYIVASPTIQTAEANGLVIRRGTVYPTGLGTFDVFLDMVDAVT